MYQLLLNNILTSSTTSLVVEEDGERGGGREGERGAVEERMGGEVGGVAKLTRSHLTTSSN